MYQLNFMPWYRPYHVEVRGVPPGGSLRTMPWYEQYHLMVGIKSREV
ncbi:hypothetical protein [Bacteroides clarus]|nr:hypothetical protein [Bacteroides clarus]